eukprot:1444590-Rhodomonas_salina.2
MWPLLWLLIWQGSLTRPWRASEPRLGSLAALAPPRGSTARTAETDGGNAEIHGGNAEIDGGKAEINGGRAKISGEIEVWFSV